MNSFKSGHKYVSRLVALLLNCGTCFVFPTFLELALFGWEVAWKGV